MTRKDIRIIQKELTKSIQGQVLDSGDFGYKESVSIDNGRVAHEPYLVVVPSNSQDVAAVVKYCGSNKIKLTIKSGGHSASGYCLNSSGLVLDLSRLNSIETIEKGDMLRIGMGTKWIQAYNYLHARQSDYIAAGGGCPGVGLGGFLLGGGYSFISRSYGLGVDSVKTMKFVASDGEIHTLNAQSSNKHEKDLMWALKGCGGGNFGIVTEVDLEIHKTPAPKMMMGQVSFPFYRIREIMEFYNEWAPTLPNEMAVYGMLRWFSDPSQGGKRVLSVRFTPIYNGPFEEGVKLLEPLVKLNPKSMELYAMSLPEWENFIGNVTLIKGRSAYIRSVLMAPKSLTDDVVDIFMKYMGRAPSQDSYVVWTHAGGKIKDFGNDTSCYAHRDAEYLFEVKSIWNSDETQMARTNIEWAVKFFDKLEKHSQGAYINYIDPLLQDWQRKYYGAQYNRLKTIKEHWDPSGQFDFQQGIGSRFSPDRDAPLDLSPLTRTF